MLSTALLFDGERSQIAGPGSDTSEFARVYVVVFIKHIGQKLACLKHRSIYSSFNSLKIT